MTPVPKDSTDHSFFFELVDSTTGLPKTGIVYTDVTASYARSRGARVAITMASLASASAAWSSGGFILVDDTNQPGVVRVDVPNTAFATGVEEVAVTLKATGCRTVTRAFRLTDTSDQDAVRGGMTALPDVASGSAGGVIVQGTGTTGLNVASGKAPATVAAGDLATDSIAAIKAKTDLIATNSADSPNAATAQTQVAALPSAAAIAAALFVDGGTNKLKVNADHSVNATATVDEEAIADAVVASLTESGVTVDDASIDLISAAVAATLSTVHNLVVVQPSVDRSTVSIVIGDDYYNADGRAIRIAIPGTPPDLTGASCVLRLDQDDDEDPGVTGTIYESGGTSYCRFDLPSTYTAEVHEGWQRYNAIVTLSNSHELTPIMGKLLATSRV